MSPTPLNESESVTISLEELTQELTRVAQEAKEAAVQETTAYYLPLLEGEQKKAKEGETWRKAAPWIGLAGLTVSVGAFLYGVTLGIGMQN